MIKIFDNKVWNNGEKVGWIEDNHIRNMENKKLGYFENGFVFNMLGRKVAFILDNELKYENETPSVELEHINATIEGNFPILEKCAVKVLLDL